MLHDAKQRPEKLEFTEGRNVGNTILRAIAQARKWRLPAVIFREYTTAKRTILTAGGQEITIGGELRRKPVLFVSAQGDLSEAQAPPLRVKLGEHVIEQGLRDAERFDSVGDELLRRSPAARMLTWWEANAPKEARRKAA